MAGFTMFHASGIFLMLAGGFIGSAPEELLNKTNKLRTELKEIEKLCATQHKAKRMTPDLCALPAEDVKSARAAAMSLHETALRVVGFRTTFDAFGLKSAFTLTFTQIVGALVFFFELFKSWLRGRGAGKNLS